MATADLITSFLNNEMDPDQEREFLLSVASSDSMRLELKSHVMLDRILESNARNASVPLELRSRIFAEAGIVPNAQTASAPAATATAPTMLSRISRGMLAALLTLSGFALGYFVAGQTDVQPSTAGVEAASKLAAPSSAPVFTVPVPVFDLLAAEDAQSSTGAAAAAGSASTMQARDRGSAQARPATTSPAAPAAIGTSRPAEVDGSSNANAASSTQATSPARSNPGASLIIDGRPPTDAERKNARQNEE